MIVKKKEMKTKGVFEIIKVISHGNERFQVVNLKNEHKNEVWFEKTAGSLCCSCEYGTIEFASEQIDELHRCKHIAAVREFVSSEAHSE